MSNRILLRFFALVVGVSIGVIILFAGKRKVGCDGVKPVPIEKISKSIKYVLYWSPFWNTKDYFYGYGFDPFNNCEYKNCYATDNRTFIPLEQYDALLFHATYNKKKHGVPSSRLPHQRYILMNVEAPVYICPDLKQYAGYFNWTMSYRFDSDIVRRHGYVFQQKTDYVTPSPSSVRTKKKLAAWFVSHCNTSGKRELLVEQLQKFIPVDVYGRCGKMKCSTRRGLSSPDCYNMVEREYKFYLSFENSFCRDYSTEKLYNLLQKDIVPVVYGGSNYDVFTPPHSVINAADFDSAEELADYLKFLDRNEDEYLKYFGWKTDYIINTSPLPSACQICQKLNEPLQRKIYYNLHEWWWGVNNSMCKTGRELPRIVSNAL